MFNINGSPLHIGVGAMVDRLTLDEAEQLYAELMQQYRQQQRDKDEQANIDELERSFQTRACPINPCLYSDPVKRRRSSKHAPLRVSDRT